MTRFWFAVLFTLSLHLPLLADDSWTTAVEPTPSDTRTFSLDKDPRARIIVEFAEPPLLARTAKPRTVRANAAAIDSLIDRLEADLDRIEGTSARRRGLTPNAAGRRVRFEYKITFAGASTEVARETVAAIRALPYVKAVHHDNVMKPHLEQSLPQIEVPYVWEHHNVRGRGVVVAVIDTGIDYTHDSLGKGFGPGFKVSGGYDVINDDADPMDDYGHGTHVAGIVAGNAAPVIGVAPEATLLAYKVLDQNGSGSASTVLAGVERALDPNGDGDFSDHADVVNMSLGGPVEPDDPVIAAVERASAAGVVFAISAGNDGVHSSIRSPGRAPSAITVAATFRDESVASFSSRGPIGGTWAAKPDVAAPGHNIVSAGFENGTLPASGTSMAAPHVAGVAALILEKYPHWAPQQVKAAIVSTAKPLPAADGLSTQGLGAGAGRIDARRAIEASLLPSPSSVSFGLVRKRGETMSATRSISITNHGNASETLTVAPPVLPAGATLTATPASFTLAEGETAEVTLTLALAAKTPDPNEDEVALTGSVEIAGARSSLRIPWVLVNGDVISVTYTGSDEFDIGIAGGPFAEIWQEGPRTYGGFVQFSETSDVVIVSESPDGEGRVVVREVQPVNGYTTVTVSPEEATLRLEVKGVDERGIPLAALNPPGVDTPGVTQQFKLSSNVRAILGYGDRRALRVSPLSLTSIMTYETVFTDRDRYFARYRDLSGLTRDETLRLAPSDWASQKIQYACRTACEVIVGAGVGSFTQYNFFPIPPGSSSWTLHLTPPLDDANQFRAYAIVRETDIPLFPRINPWTFMTPAMRNDRGRIAFAPFGRLTPADYYAADAQTPVMMGDGPAVLLMSMARGTLYLNTAGTLGESLGVNLLEVEANQFDGEGNAMPMVRISHGTFIFKDQQDQRGPRRLEITDKYQVAGRPGRLVQTSRYDSRVRWSAPSLSTFRVVGSNGAVTTTVAAGSRPRLLFSARVPTWDELCCSLVHRPVTGSATQVWWRPRGAGTWNPLPVTVTGTDYEYDTEMPGSPGTLFTADLQSAAANPVGEVDLKILLVDEVQGSTEIVYEPAFIVDPTPGRRRAVR